MRVPDHPGKTATYHLRKNAMIIERIKRGEFDSAGSAFAALSAQQPDLLMSRLIRLEPAHVIIHGLDLRSIRLRERVITEVHRQRLAGEFKFGGKVFSPLIAQVADFAHGQIGEVHDRRLVADQHDGLIERKRGSRLDQYAKNKTGLKPTERSSIAKHRDNFILSCITT
jgi:hypothetical protein